MIWWFMVHPMWYLVPIIPVLLAQVVSVWLFGKRYTGEWETLRDPLIIAFNAVLWPLIVPFLIVWLVMTCAGKLIGLVLPKRNG